VKTMVGPLEMESRYVRIWRSAILEDI